METAVKNSVASLVREVLASQFFSALGGPLVATFQEGHPESNVLLIAGENATGKSLMVSILATYLNHDKVEPLQVSMKYRTRGGLHRTFMFGPLGDEEDSTGNVSLIAIKGAIKAAESRDKPNWVMLDEPDTGLADSYCGALGQYLAQFGNRLPLKECQGLSVVTHSRKLVSSMLFSLEKTPHFLNFTDVQSNDPLQTWLEDEREQSVESLLALGDNSRALFSKINSVLNKLRKEKA